VAKQGRYPQELRERAVRMVQDGRKEYPSQWQAIASIAGKFGMHPVTLHEWVKRAEIDAGRRAGLTTEERARLKQLVGVRTVLGRCARKRAADVITVEDHSAQGVAERSRQRGLPGSGRASDQQQRDLAELQVRMGDLQQPARLRSGEKVTLLMAQARDLTAHEGAIRDVVVHQRQRMGEPLNSR
jgi:transposase